MFHDSLFLKAGCSKGGAFVQRLLERSSEGEEFMESDVFIQVHIFPIWDATYNYPVEQEQHQTQ